MRRNITIPNSQLVVLNQLYHLEHRLKSQSDSTTSLRMVARIKDTLACEGILASVPGGEAEFVCLHYEDPMGQPFKETRTDLEATIAGQGDSDLVVVEVIKPTIRASFRDRPSEPSMVVQRGIVVVEKRPEQRA